VRQCWVRVRVHAFYMESRTVRDTDACSLYPECTRHIRVACAG
jgi:hypothetical protein